MANVKRWFKHLRCLFAGCRLSATCILSYRDEATQTTTFKNHCVRCGREFKAVIPNKALDNFEPIRLEVANCKLWK